MGALVGLAALLALPALARQDPLPAVTQDLRLLSRDSNDARGEAVRDLLAARGLRFSVQDFENPFPGAIRARGSNIIVDLGDGPRDIVVGAHYDAAATSDGITSGALDNGAGVIVLQRLAGTLAESRLRHRVRIVFFDMEELGLIGSAHFASTAEPGRIAAMVNVDVTGSGQTVVLGPSESPGNEVTYEAAAAACARTGLGCLTFPRYPPSDDRSFQEAGIPNISVGVLPRLQSEQLWMRLNGGHATGRPATEQPRVFSLIHTRDDVPEEVEPLAVTTAHRFVLELVLQLDRALSPS